MNPQSITRLTLLINKGKKKNNKKNACSSVVQNKHMDVEQWRIIRPHPYHDGLSLSHMFAFLCHGVAYCSDVYANEPS